MRFLAEILKDQPEYRTLAAHVANGRLPVSVTGLSLIHKAHLIYSLCTATGRKPLVITPDEQEATKLSGDLNSMFGGGVYFYPSRDFTLRPVEGVSREYEHERLRILGRMARGDYHAVVMCADAALQLTLPPKVYLHRTVEIRLGREMPIGKVVLALTEAGYSHTEQVEGMGQYAVRGGILDFFPPESSNPIRVEFWGDEPDTISLFDAESQRRTASLEKALITPAVEVMFGAEENGAERLEAFRTTLKSKAQAKANASILADIRKLREQTVPASFDRYLPLCYPEPGTVFDYAENSLLFVSEQQRVKERVKNTLWQFSQDADILFQEGFLCKGLDRFYLEWSGLCSQLEKKGCVLLDTFAHAGLELRLYDIISVNARQLAVWSGGLQLLCEDLKAQMEKHGSAVVLCGAQRNCETLVSDLEKQEISAYTVNDPEKAGPPAAGSVLILPGRLSAGFEYPNAGFMLISHGNVAASSPKMKAGRHKPGRKISSLADITPGDYVVHTMHGIGIYEGIHKLEVQGVVKDYIKIRYAGKDTLYVPVTQLDLVSKYIGPREEAGVRLNKMGGTEWQKAKSRVRAAVKDMAKELIALYAARQQVKGYAFPEDDDWQRQFEEHFEYEETEDQLRCSYEIKQDMHKPFPMDRLLCGDVGFGKTEVALRAAFKCVMGGKQCAFLVPTTILAWQHYQTILRRFEGFPVKVELLSRFRTPKQQEEIIRKLRRGEMDIVVGTHRLVQKDVTFKNLGLVIVDEEQRFGVAQKEKLKELFKSVDVLSLSATPIPRTMNMALSGIRDMSVIEEAPQDRHPVQTYVLESDMGIVSDAIRKEIRRGGQVYYLHNRIETIGSTAQRLQAAVPEARIGIAHGKMNEEELSVVWEQLLNNEIDVLLCTTIIETGVDVPNCNTLIIEDADHMGLSQLHQIRGRVGRSSRRAYAYFMFKRGKVLSEIATKRLSAIREFTEFGSGFQIALRDLEIRGAGNILGSQQHGHMAAVGYDMYLKLLNEAVLDEKGENRRESDECMVDIQVSAHIPEDYIRNSGQRLEIYRRIADIHSEEDVSDVLDELIDRFSDPPQAVKSLVDVALMRNMAASFGIREITQKGNVILLFPEKLDLSSVSGLVKKLRGRVMVNAGQKPYISVRQKETQSPVETIREALDALAGQEADEEGREEKVSGVKK